ncbi:MAG: hypothetical protein K6G28_05140 [Acholeplasmatales bacterium]|nr:hypothetical protein [Acholeplasmatales bacterium]
MGVFISVTVTLAIFIVLILIYMIYMLFKIKTIKKQILLHQEKKLDTTYVMASVLPLIILLSANQMIGIDFALFIIMCTLAGYCVYLTDEYNSYSKQLIEIIEEEKKHAKMESK